MGRNLFQRHQHEAAFMHERMGQDQGPASLIQRWPVNDPPAVVDEVEIEGASAPPAPHPPTGATLDCLEKPQHPPN